MNERYFIDTNQNKWIPKITLYHAGRIKRALELNVENVDDVTTMVQDPAILADVLFISCEQQAREKGISEEEFGLALGGDSMKHARRAILFAISDFFEDMKTRTVFLDLIKTLEAEGKKNLELLFNHREQTKANIRRSGHKWRQELEASLKKQAESLNSDEPDGETQGKSKISGKQSGKSPE